MGRSTPEESSDVGGARQLSDADPSWLSRESFPFTSRFVTLQGQRVHYIDEGRGPILLFLHGNPTWSFLYRRIIQGLAPAYRCIALDYPGFGLSSATADYDLTPAAHARIVEEFVRHFELPKFSVVAHDWGGPIGLACALAMPERLAGLVLFNTFAWPAQGDAHFERFSRLMSGTVGRALVRHMNIMQRMMMSRACSHSAVSTAARRAYAGPFASRESRRAMSVFAREILGSQKFLDDLGRRREVLQDVPALLLWAERDIAFKARHRLRLQTCFRCRTTVLLPHAGHFPQEDCPEMIVAIMQSWLSQRVTADGGGEWWSRHTTDLDSAETQRTAASR
jgi:haloalkane dehalogenase